MNIYLTEIKETLRPEESEDSPEGYEIEYEVEEISVDGFRQLVNHLTNGGYFHPSNYPATGGIREWISSEPWEDQTGEVVRYSLHFGKSNPEWTHKYWKKALTAIGMELV